MKRPIRVPAFPDGRWQVIWYGDLAYRPSSGLQSQPFIALALSKLDDTTAGVFRIEVRFSLIAIIPLGSIWEDGVRTLERPADGLEERQVLVIPIRVNEVRAGETIDGSDTGAHLLPFGLFKQHRDHTGSFCLRWRSPEGQIMMLPSVEAIRFYFGTSSDLLKRVVTGARLDSLWLDKSIDPVTRHATLTLAPDVPRKKSAAEIARIAFDRTAREAAEIVHRSLQIATTRKEKGYARARFPFTRPSTLTVAGRSFTPPSGPPRFVILRIDSCTAPYPFAALKVFGGEEIEERRDEEASDQAAGTSGSVGMSEIHSAEPNAVSASRGETRWEGHRFVDLVHKRIDFRDEPQSLSSGGGPAGDDSLFGLGDGDWIGEGNFLELNSSIPTADQIAFIDDRLVTDGNDGADESLWRELVSSLQEQSPQVCAVLVASIRPTWAINSNDVDACLCLDLPVAWNADDEARTIDVLAEWVSRRCAEARGWKLFLRLEGDRRLSSRVAIVNQDLELSGLVEHVQAVLLDEIG